MAGGMSSGRRERARAAIEIFVAAVEHFLHIAQRLFTARKEQLPARVMGDIG